jgi:hypothetical protein
MIVDVDIRDYSEETMEKFSLLFASLYSKQFQIQSMQIIKTAFYNDGKDKEFEYFLRSALIKQKLIEKTQQMTKGANDPIIEPIDLV